MINKRAVRIRKLPSGELPRNHLGAGLHQRFERQTKRLSRDSQLISLA